MASTTTPPANTRQPRTKSVSKTVLPKDLKVRFGSDRLVDIRTELTKLKRDEFPNAGAALLRVFLELSILDCLKRTGDLEPLIERIEKREHRKLRFGAPEMKDLAPAVVGMAKSRLPHADALRVEKALTYDAASQFTLSHLHSFVHSPEDFPSG